MALSVTAAALYLPVFAGLVIQWYEDPNASYGAVAAVAAAVAGRQRWACLRALPPVGCRWGVAALMAAAAVYAVGVLAADLFALRMSAVMFAAAIVWFVWGTTHLRTLAPAIVLCAVAIPPPAALVTELTMPLQLAASQVAAGVLGAGGFEVARDGNILTLSHITLEVAEACSGMRSLVTLLALVTVYWGVAAPPTGRVLILALATVPVALAGNGLRVVATALLATRMGHDAVRGTIHEATGLAAFAVMCAALAALHVAASSMPRRRPI